MYVRFEEDGPTYLWFRASEVLASKLGGGKNDAWMDFKNGDG